MPIQRIAYHGLSHRLAEETQLLAEQKWIVEALTKIRNQRNSLQIERLHLESMKAQLRTETEKNITESNGSPSPGFSRSVDGIQNQPPSSCSIEFEVPIINMDDLCNEEELDLTVDQHIIHNTERSTFDMEEDDDDDDDDDNSEDVFIDMNMLMNGKQFKISNNKEHANISSWTSS